MIVSECAPSITSLQQGVYEEHSRLGLAIRKVTPIVSLQERNDHLNVHAKNFIANGPSGINSFHLSGIKKKAVCSFLFVPTLVFCVF